jgi:hypothetical protein
VILMALIAGPIGASRVAAQVPPHPAGSICFTPQFWCWANPPGRPGWSCSCATPYGWVGGRLG